MRPKYFRRTTIALVFAKLVSLTQTFDSLGSINASRHVASLRKEQTKRREEARRRVRYPIAKHAENRRIAQWSTREHGVTIRINYETVLHTSLYSSRLHSAYFILASQSRRKANPVESGSDDRLENEVGDTFPVSRYEKRNVVVTINCSTTKAVLPLRSRIRVAVHSLN